MNIDTKFKDMTPEMKRLVLKVINRMRDQSIIEIFQDENGDVCVRKLVKENE